jgi:hypothetical protein
VQGLRAHAEVLFFERKRRIYMANSTKMYLIFFNIAFLIVCSKESSKTPQRATKVYIKKYMSNVGKKAQK